MSILLEGVKVVDAKKMEIQKNIASLKSRGIIPTLAIIGIAPKSSELIYENIIKKNADIFGVAVKSIHMESNTSTAELCEKINSINDDKEIHGCLILQPLPQNIDTNKVRKILNPSKDIDGFTFSSLSAVFSGIDNYSLGFAPCTAQACIEILKHYNISVRSKSVSVIGRSLVIGRPVALMLSNRQATVTICHSKTRNLMNICKNSDIVISAAGVARLVNRNFMSQYQIILDVGINFNKDGKICGDVDFEFARNNVAAVTPVPGGVGVVTTCVLIENVVLATKNLTCCE